MTEKEINQEERKLLALESIAYSLESISNAIMMEDYYDAQKKAVYKRPAFRITIKL